MRLRDIKLDELQVARRNGKHFDVARPVQGQQSFFWRWPLAGYNFVPVIRHAHELHCHLEIRLFRPLDKEGIVFDGGDLDGRLKLLFDALRVPLDLSELPSLSAPVTDDNSKWPIFFCLMDDDRAITKLSIQSHKLLTPVPAYPHPENYAECDIDVTIMPAAPITGNIGYLYP